MPLAKAFGVKTAAHDPAPGQPRSLWQLFRGTAGDIEPEAARFIAKKTGKDPTTGTVLSAKQRQTIGMSATKSVSLVQCCSGTDRYLLIVLRPTLRGPLMAVQEREPARKDAGGPPSFGTLVLLTIGVLGGILLVEVGPSLCYRWIVRLAKLIVDNAVHEDL